MLTLDDLINEIKKLLKPIKEDVEVTKSKVSHIEAKQGVMYIKISSIEESLSVLNEKVDEGFTSLDEKIDGVLKHADNIEEIHEKRLKKVESKLGITP